jgi:hypothetical protein
MANFYLANESLLLLHASPYRTLKDTDILHKQHGYYLQTALRDITFTSESKQLKPLKPLSSRILRTNRR